MKNKWTDQGTGKNRIQRSYHYHENKDTISSKELAAICTEVQGSEISDYWMVIRETLDQLHRNSVL